MSVSIGPMTRTSYTYTVSKPASATIPCPRIQEHYTYLDSPSISRLLTQSNILLRRRPRMSSTLRWARIADLRHVDSAFRKWQRGRSSCARIWGKVRTSVLLQLNPMNPSHHLLTSFRTLCVSQADLSPGYYHSALYRDVEGQTLFTPTMNP